MFRRTLLFAALATLAATPAFASFHVMQVEQVIGGVAGDVNRQAIQLRMRTSFQNQMQLSRIHAWDASGANPVLIIDMTAPVSNSTTGSRVLIESADFAAHHGPTPDFTMTNVIPSSYLAAGSLTFEDDFGTIYWRVSWGGASYTGSTTGSITNDADGNFGPPVGTALPSTGISALRFSGTAAAASTTNLADYATTSGGATFTNNAGTSATLDASTGVGPSSLAGVSLGRPSPNPATGRLSYDFELARDARVHVQVLDVTGRVVQTLVDEAMPAGHHARTWEFADRASQVPSGVYLLRLEADGVRQTRRFAIL